MTYANVAVTFALVFAMTGGAYAANKYLITSTKQIKPSVLKQLQGKAGANGAQGAAGPAGAGGAQGPSGPQGPAGPGGGPGAPGKEGPQGKEGKEGKPGTTGFTETLPSEKTEQGMWSVAVPVHDPTAGISAPRAPISFVIPLSAPPAAHFLKEGEGATAECPGTALEPKASPGNLCVYTEFALDVPALSVGVLRKFGAIVSANGGEPGGFAVGSWAVTAE
jgi:hypothetical protein